LGTIKIANHIHDSIQVANRTNNIRLPDLSATHPHTNGAKKRVTIAIDDKTPIS
jgi:hypothetical protein